jgi:hypothetical protein
MKNLAIKRGDCLEHGFTYSTADDEHPECMVCTEIFRNDSMKPVRMKRNMAVKNTHFKGKSIKFFTGN